MGDFFKSTKFKIILMIFFLLLGFIVAAARYGILGTITSQVVDTVTSPLKEASAFVSNKFASLFERYASSSVYYDAYLVVQDENRELKEMLIDFEKYKKENEQFRKMFNVMEENDDKQLTDAIIIGRDPADVYNTFSINKGSKHGITEGDPVITPDGLVGYIAKVTDMGATVQTILNPETNVGTYSTREIAVGIAHGDLSHSLEGNIIMDNILKDADVKIGDTIVTAGEEGSLYPSKIIIGTVLSVEKKSTGTSRIAVIKPAVDVASIKDVWVIVSFLGQNQDVFAEGSSISGDNNE